MTDVGHETHPLAAIRPKLRDLGPRANEISTSQRGPRREGNTRWGCRIQVLGRAAGVPGGCAASTICLVTASHSSFDCIAIVGTSSCAQLY